MGNSIIIRYNDGFKQFFTCPACIMKFYDNGAEPVDESIPHYSPKEAINNGWRCTRDRRFSENGYIVWVCPDCWPGDELL